MVVQVRDVLYDTNILIDATKGVPAALDELEHWDNPAISSVTWIEVYAGAATEDEKAVIDTFMEQFGFEVLEVTDAIMRSATDIMFARRQKGGKLKVPDAIIAATAKTTGRVLITRNPKDFLELGPVRTPYTLVTECTVRVENELDRGVDPTPNALERKTRPTITILK